MGQVSVSKTFFFFQQNNNKEINIIRRSSTTNNSVPEVSKPLFQNQHLLILVSPIY